MSPRSFRDSFAPAIAAQSLCMQIVEANIAKVLELADEMERNGQTQADHVLYLRMESTTWTHDVFRVDEVERKFKTRGREVAGYVDLLAGKRAAGELTILTISADMHFGVMSLRLDVAQERTSRAT